MSRINTVVDWPVGRKTKPLCVRRRLGCADLWEAVAVVAGRCLQHSATAARSAGLTTLSSSLRPPPRQRHAECSGRQPHQPLQHNYIVTTHGAPLSHRGGSNLQQARPHGIALTKLERALLSNTTPSPPNHPPPNPTHQV